MIGAVRWQELREKNIKHCKISWTLDLVTESLVELNATLDLVNRKPCRTQLDIGRGTTESLVELNSTLDLVQRKALSNLTRHWTWYSGKPCRTQLDIGPGTTESHVELNWTLDCNRPAHLIHSVVFAWNLLYRTKIVECCEINKELLRWFFFLRNLKYLLSDLVHDIRS